MASTVRLPTLTLCSALALGCGSPTTGGQTGDEPLRPGYEATDVPPRHARSTVDFGPFKEMPSSSALVLLAREAPGTGVPEWRLEYRAGVRDDAGVLWIVQISIPSEESVAGQARFAVPGLVEEPVTRLELMAHSSTNGSSRFFRAKAGRAHFGHAGEDGAELELELELEAIEFEEPLVMPPDPAGVADLPMAGTITGEFERSCAFLAPVMRPSPVTQMGEPARPSPSWMPDADWSSAFCSKLAP